MTTKAGCDVLIVEDNIAQCDELAEYIGRTGLTVQTAHSGPAALERAGAFPPRVVLLDYDLPGMNGVQVAAQLRAALPSAEMLMMSGRLEGVSEQTLSSIGITAFVNKPVPPGPLRQAVVKLAKATPELKTLPRETGWLSAGLGGTR